MLRGKTAKDEWDAEMTLIQPWNLGRDGLGR